MKLFESSINLDEIVFENRNKAYGAYYLRKKYKQNVVIALFFALGFLCMSVGTPFAYTYMSPEVIVIGNMDDTHVFDPMKIPEDEIPLPPLPPTPPPPVNSILEHPNFAPQVVDNIDEIPDETITDTDNPSVVSADSVPSGNYTTYEEPPAIVEDPVNNEKMVYKPFEVAEMPVFKGGDSEMYKYFVKEIHYNSEAIEMKIEGTVYVEFIVDALGKITNAKVVKKVDPLLDKEALKVVSAMPDWIPGRQSGNPVRVCMTIPIAFKLK